MDYTFREYKFIAKKLIAKFLLTSKPSKFLLITI